MSRRCVCGKKTRENFWGELTNMYLAKERTLGKLEKHIFMVVIKNAFRGGAKGKLRKIYVGHTLGLTRWFASFNTKTRRVNQPRKTKIFIHTETPTNLPNWQLHCAHYLMTRIRNISLHSRLLSGDLHEINYVDIIDIGGMALYLETWSTDRNRTSYFSRFLFSRRFMHCRCRITVTLMSCQSMMYWRGKRGKFWYFPVSYEENGVETNRRIL